MPCNLHFGDSTAHATVKWFLKSLTEEGWIPSEELCKELNVVRFIDCLRKKVERKKSHFNHIEKIAKELLKNEKWKNCPHLSVLLFSMARNFLVNQSKDGSGSVKKTSLYCVAEKIYGYFKTQLSSAESCSHVFKAGFQLAHFQEDSEWHQEYAVFKDQHYNELRDLRFHYYSIPRNNLTDFSHRFVERLKWTKDLQEFDEYEKEFQELNPLRMELPIPARSIRASEFAEDFVRSLEIDKKDNEESIDTKLAREFRVVQWEVLLRNLVEEDRGPENGKRKLCFYPVTVNYKRPGMPDEKFLDSFIEKTREAEFLFTPSHGEIPTKKRSDSSVCASAGKEFHTNKRVIDEVDQCRQSFRKLLPQIPIKYSFVHEDLVSSFNNKRDTGQASNIILIEDGEFSFFSVLWFLRHAAAKGEEPTKFWGSDIGFDSTKKLTVRFRPDKNDSSEWWSKSKPHDMEDKQHNMYEFAEECGWIILLPESKCVPTRRWQSFIAWLRRYNNSLNKLKSMHGSDPPFEEKIERLPVKKLDYEENSKEGSFIKKLWEFLSSGDLNKILNRLKVSGTSMRCVDFAKNELGPLVEGLEPLLEVESPAGLDDRVLLHCSRGFIPLEHLFRAYQSCELHVLFQALNWEKLSDAEENLTPISISGTTIAGRVESHQNDKTIFDNWLVPYRSLFSTLSAGIALPAAQEDSKQIGEDKQKKTFAHQTGRLLNVAWSDMRDKLNFRGQFALWLALTQVTKIWGRDDLDTIEEINKHFPEWGPDPSEIVDQLVNRGLWEGIVRGARPPVSGKPDDPRWALTTYLEELGGNPEEIVDQMRKSLLFKFESPKGIGPPEWVRTVAFAICFYHGMRQAAYHALETYVINDKCKPSESCLKVKWNSQSVSIYNRGIYDKEHFHEDFEANDRPFFELFQDRTNEFCRKKGIDEVFEIDGPEPSKTLDEYQEMLADITASDGPEPSKILDTWQLVIKKHKLPPNAK